MGAKIVNVIYKQAVGDQEPDAKVRLLVLVPSWKTKREKKQAKAEIQQLKKAHGEPEKLWEGPSEDKV